MKGARCRKPTDEQNDIRRQRWVEIPQPRNCVTDILSNVFFGYQVHRALTNMFEIKRECGTALLLQGYAVLCGLDLFVVAPLFVVEPLLGAENAATTPVLMDVLEQLEAPRRRRKITITG